MDTFSLINVAERNPDRDLSRENSPATHCKAWGAYDPTPRTQCEQWGIPFLGRTPGLCPVCFHLRAGTKKISTPSSADGVRQQEMHAETRASQVEAHGEI